MPELPEVETVRRGLEPLMRGHVFNDVETRRPLRFPFPERFAARLKGAKVKSLGRRAKYLMAGLSTHETLVMHLGMTGRFSVKRKGEAEGHQIGDYENGQPATPSTTTWCSRCRAARSSPTTMPRRFGYMTLIAETELHEHAFFAGLGVEPLERRLTPEYLAAARGRQEGAISRRS